MTGRKTVTLKKRKTTLAANHKRMSVQFLRSLFRTELAIFVTHTGAKCSTSPMTTIVAVVAMPRIVTIVIIAPARAIVPICVTSVATVVVTRAIVSISVVAGTVVVTVVVIEPAQYQCR